MAETQLLALEQALVLGLVQEHQQKQLLVQRM
jgi:hypothetical protein